MKRLLKAADTAVGFTCRLGVIVAIVVLFVLLLSGIVKRSTGYGISGYDEIVELATFWMVMLGVLAFWREGTLYRVTTLVDAFPNLRRGLELVTHLVMAITAAIFVYYGYDFAFGTYEQTPFLAINKALFYSALPLCGAVMLIYSVVALGVTLRGGSALAVSSDLEGGAASSNAAPVASH